MPYRVRNPEPKPPGKHRGKKKITFNRKKPLGGPSLQKVNHLAESWPGKGREEEKDRTERVKTGRDREKTNTNTSYLRYKIHVEIKEQ